MSAQRAPDHVMQTAVVFDDLRLVYVPVPKAASTTILGALSEVAGLRSEDRARSRKLEVTRALTVHDGSMWGSSHRLKAKSESELEWILKSDDWFRFTVVRDPARRIWSAWVSKVLSRNPRFVLMFGEELFPAVPSTATDVLDSFRRFIGALPDRPDWSDSHWSMQADLLRVPDIAYSHIGRVEALDRTEAEVSEYICRRGGRFAALGAANRSFLPFSSGLFDRVAHDACVRLSARDCDAFGYERLPFAEAGPDESWYASVEANIPAIRTVIEQNERFLDLWRLLTDKESGRGRARTPSGHRVRSARAAVASAGFRRGSADIAVRLIATAISLAVMLVLLPEMFGDRPYDPRPSNWPAAIESH